MDVISVYAPSLVYLALGIGVVLIVTVILRHVTVDRQLVLLGAVIVAGYGLYAFGLIASVAGALRKGVLTTGEVVAGGDGRRARVELQGEAVEVRLRRIYRPGERLSLLVDPLKKSPLLVVGAAR